MDGLLKPTSVTYFSPLNPLKNGSNTMIFFK